MSLVPQDDIVSIDVRIKLEDLQQQLGTERAVQLLQRCVGRPETGGLTPQDVELVNAANAQNLLRGLRNVAIAEVRLQKGSADDLARAAR